MNSKLKVNDFDLYETDYLMWIENTLQKLKLQNYSEVDWINLLDEIESIARSERSSLDDNLVVLLLHILKWQYQPEGRSGSWKGSIREHRRRIRKLLKDSPSLNPYLEQIFVECYNEAIQQASAETGIPLEAFPADCLFTVAEALEKDFTIE